jgi:hypothetical protein
MQANLRLPIFLFIGVAPSTFVGIPVESEVERAFMAGRANVDVDVVQCVPEVLN